MMVLAGHLVIFRHIYEIWKENPPLKWKEFLTRCLPIAFTMFVHVSERENFFHQIVEDLP